jgi:succinyl-CoA synthetase alpha subunit
VSLPQPKPSGARIASGEEESRSRPAIRRVPREDLPGIQPLLFRELDHRIGQTRLGYEPLPEGFLTTETEADGSALVFRGELYDLNITLFTAEQRPAGPTRGSGVFVVSNGAGVATNTVDQLSRSIPVAGMIDLKRNFHQEKITAALEMARTVRPDMYALAINMISGIALAPDTVKAVERFCTSVAGSIPVILRFSGPRGEEHRSMLIELEQSHAAVTLADSTRDLVEKTTALFGIAPDATATANHLAKQVEEALDARSRLGVTMDPRAWLTPDRTIERVFGIKERTRIGVLGFGRTAQFQLQVMKEHGARVCWAVTPNAGKYADSGIAGIEVFPTVKEAVAAGGDVDVVVNYAPAAHTLDATRDCLEGSSQARLMILVAENLPYEKTIRTMDALEASEVACIGPNSPGVMIVDDRGGRPDLLKFGNMPPHLFEIAGGMSVVGRSGTVIFDIVERATATGIGTRMAWAIGGDKYTGLGFLEALVMLEQDPHTRFIVLGGESGGIQEQLAARLVATGIVSKPVIALVTGESLPAGVQCGHQGAVKFTEADDPSVKEQHLLAAGAIVVSNPTEVIAAIEQIERIGWNLEERRREALWGYLVDAGRITGFRWHQGLRPAYDLLYGLVGHYRIFDAQERTPDHLHDLATDLAGIGIDRFSYLLSTLIRPDAFVTAFEKSREYLAEMVRGIHETGLENFTILVEDVFSEASFNRALAATPWAAADLINESHEVGISETQNTIAKTVGARLFQETLAERPWNTAHAFRSINNMRWWRYVRAYDRYCTHLTGDNQLPKASWQRNPWASVKMVRGYDRMPEDELEHALDDPDTRALFFERSRSDPQELLDLGKKAFAASRSSGRPFHELYREQVRQGVPDAPEIEAEIARMGAGDFQALVDSVFTQEGFRRSCELHQNSTARALRIINEMGDAEASGAQKIIRIHRDHLETFDTPSFRLAVERNLWMVVDLLRAASRLDAVDLNRIVDYVVSQQTFNYSVAEHQWGTSQAFHKIADMGPTRFLDTHRVLEDVTHDRECFAAGFKKNPRDAVEIVQVVANIGRAALSELMSDPATREAFLTRMRVCPRNAAHFLQEVAQMGIAVFNRLVDDDLGRPLVNEMLRTRGCALVRLMRRLNIVGVDDSQRELRTWRSENPSGGLTPANAVEVIGLVKERVLARRFSDPERRIPVGLPGQQTYLVSEGEIRGLYQSYPEWGDVLFKLHGGEAMTPAERVDVYRLVSGRKRFQTHMVSIFTNFLPLQTIRARINAGESLIRELPRLRGVTQGSGHRFDVYFHTLEVLDQLVDSVLPLDFVSEAVRRRVHAMLEEQIGHVSRRDLLLLASALHDLGKTGGAVDETARHARRSVEAARPVLARFGLSDAQKRLVLDVISHHVPAKQRSPGESWEDFVKRGGLEGLYQSITGNGENAYPVESILHYHADILGRRGDETPPAEVERRKQVTAFLLERHMREHPEPTAAAPEPAAS